MPKHNVKLIVNPNADLGRAWKWAKDLRPVIEEFGGADWSGTVYPTHASELAYQASLDGYELVVAAGGDGTVHEVVNGLMKAPAGSRPRLGVVPLGTGNDFAFSIGMNHDKSLALRQIMTGKPHPVDIGLLRDGHDRQEYWDNTLGVGFDTTVTIRSRNIPLLHGFPVYLLAVLQTIILNHNAMSMTIKTDTESWKMDMLMMALCNGGREGGGFLLSPQARNEDGVFEYTGIQKVSRPMMLRLLPEVMRGTHGHFKQVRMGQFHQMEIHADLPLYIHTDGEIFSGFGTDIHSLTAEILPGSLQVVC